MGPRSFKWEYRQQREKSYMQLRWNIALFPRHTQISPSASTTVELDGTGCDVIIDILRAQYTISWGLSVTWYTAWLSVFIYLSVCPLIILIRRLDSSGLWAVIFYLLALFFLSKYLDRMAAWASAIWSVLVVLPAIHTWLAASLALNLKN